ncbi:hypothetical protein DE146DRAFT_666450 [Phaeosphaeria sp. MPI-PUGE-AT-0046c]|nr:hypothetical protein DE146DRAFT_666450 [Phaeosphaeria sp. MPI-PUGE-AT-0046c]
MAPTTRAAARCLTSLTAATNALDHGRRTKQKSFAQQLPKTETRYLTDALCRFLELPAELRNRIYEYAAEDLDNLTYAPRVTRKACKPWDVRIWQFFGLTQTCRQIRSEFGPIWLLKLNVRSTLSWINKFIASFVVGKQLLDLAPRRVQIEWDTGMHDSKDTEHDLTRLLHLHANNLSHSIAFIPERLLDGNTPDDICWYCFGEFEAEERGDDDFENWVERCTCAPEDLDHDGWVSYCYDLINRTDMLLAVICHNNEAWQQDIRSEKMEVQCIFGKSTEPITFRILCKERFCEAEVNGDALVHAKKARELLTKWGVLDVATDEMEFVVAFKMEQKMEENGYEMISTEVREVHIAKAGSR